MFNSSCTTSWLGWQKIKYESKKMFRNERMQLLKRSEPNPRSKEREIPS